MPTDTPNVFKTKQGRIVLIVFLLTLSMLIGMEIYEHVARRNASSVSTTASISETLAPPNDAPG